MKFRIMHEIPGRIRVRAKDKGFSAIQAETLIAYLGTIPGIERAKVYERTGSVCIWYSSGRNSIIHALRAYRYSDNLS